MVSFFNNSSALLGLSPQDNSYFFFKGRPLRSKPSACLRFLSIAWCYWTDMDTSVSPISTHLVPKHIPAVKTPDLTNTFILLALVQVILSKIWKHINLGYCPSLVTFHPLWAGNVLSLKNHNVFCSFWARNIELIRRISLVYNFN